MKQDISAVMLYLTFFGQIQSGPLSRYEDLQNSINQDRNQDSILQDLLDGTYRFIIGFNKKILLANVLSNITMEVFNTQQDALSRGLAWLGAVCYSLELYFDFSGYSDMAIGISRMFGIRCPENFNYPYMISSISEFWRKWHVTLGTWFRDYVYIPMGGSRVKSYLRLVINLLVVWFLTGIWHGTSWNFVIWGLGYFVVIAIEKLTKIPQKIKGRFAKILYGCACVVFVVFQWVIFRFDDIASGMFYIKSMIWGADLELANNRALFLIKDNWIFIVVSILLCFPIITRVEKRLSDNASAKMIWDVIYHIVLGLCFLIAISFVVSGYNNPFAYANF